MENKKGLIIKFGEKSIDSKRMLILFVIIDLLVLPYIRAIHAGAGMIFVALWCLPNIMKRVKEYTWIFAAFVAFSNLNGYLFHYVGTFGVTQAIMVIYGFVLLDFFAEADLEGNGGIIKKLLVLYIILTSAFAALYAMAPEEYFSIRSNWTMSDTQIEFTTMRINRFTSIFSDPNNAGAALTALLAYILVYEDVKPLTLAVICGCTFVCVVLTYSVTALILFISVILFYLLLGSKAVEHKKKRITLFFVVCIAVGVCAEFIFAANADPSANPYIYALQKRIEGNTEDSNLGGRIPRWKELLTTLSIWDCILVGKGVVLDANGKSFQPHNGLLFLLYSYGLPAVYLYLKKFYSFAQKRLIFYLPAIVIFVAVFINVGFSDYRFLTLSTLIIALSKSKCKVLAEKAKKEA